MSQCRVRFIGDRRAIVIRDHEILATATGSDRSSAIVNLWASLLAQQREDLAALVAREHLRGEIPDDEH